jgi:hypothetical protein
MLYYVSKNGQQIGPLSEEQVKEMLSDGRAGGTDLGIEFGGTQWRPLHELLQSDGTAPAVARRSEPFSPHDIRQWAGKNLASPVEIHLKILSVIVITCCTLYILPILFLLYSVVMLLIGGGGPQLLIISAAFFGLITVAIIIALAIGVPIRLLSERKSVRFMDISGVETRNGDKYSWEQLQKINFVKANGFRLHGLGCLINLILSPIINALMFSGSSGMVSELIFTNGKAVVPPLIKDSKTIFELIKTIPAPKTGDVGE